MTYQLIRYETGDGIAQIPLDRPQKLNAWTPQMTVEQADAIRTRTTIARWAPTS